MPADTASLDEYAAEYAADFRAQVGCEPPAWLIELALLAESLARRRPNDEACRRPQLSLIQGGRDDA